MKEQLTAVMSEDETGNFRLDFRLDVPDQLAHRLDKMLKALLKTRARLAPPPSSEVTPPGVVEPAIFGAAWRVEPTLSGDIALKLHHPALGWVNWAAPPQGAIEMANWMLKLAAAAEAPPEHIQ